MSDWKTKVSSLGVKPNQNAIATGIGAFSAILANGMIERMRQYYQDQNAIGNGQLAQSLDFNEPSFSAGGFNIVFTTDADYFDFREQGVSGTETDRNSPYSFKNNHPSKAMAESINEWTRAKGIAATDGNYQALSWAIATNIKKKGFEGVQVVDNTFDAVTLASIQDSLLTLTSKIVDVQITTILPEWQ
jgi:hypothetical protein